jgi:hypothetical protein
MIRQKQLIQHNPAAGQWGDCFRTSVACLLGVPAEEVPHIADGGGSWLDSAVRRKLQAYLRPRNLMLGRIVTTMQDDTTLFSHLDWWYQQNRHLACLVTVQSIGCNHVVVCKNREVFCDPLTGKPARASTYSPPIDESLGLPYWETFFLCWIP